MQDFEGHCDDWGKTAEGEAGVGKENNVGLSTMVAWRNIIDSIYPEHQVPRYTEILRYFE